MPLPTARTITAATLCSVLSLPLAAVVAHAAGGDGAAAVETSTTVMSIGGVDAKALSELHADGDVAASPETLTREIASASSFDLAAVTWDAGQEVAGTTVEVRVHEQGGWSSWEVLPVEDGGPDPGTAEAREAAPVGGTAPLMTEGADGVQVRVDAPDGVAPRGLEVQLVDGGDEPTGRASAAAVAPAGPDAAASAGAAAPEVITRQGWGADETLARDSSTNSTLKAVTIHHTATSNSYTTASAARAQIRSMYAYHTQTRGWADIGYNFLVDKFGNVYEGRRGSISALKVGAHASGFNTSTLGISAIGNYEEAAPSSAMVTSIAQVAAWKLGRYGVDPEGTTTLTSAGGDTSRFGAGRAVTLPTIFRHLDVGYTTCPGKYMSAKLPTIRSRAADIVAAAVVPVVPAVPVVPVVPVASSLVGGVALVGDWDGNRRDEPGWFQDGTVSLRLSSGEVRRYSFGRAGDVPVVGDWDGNGVDSVGVYRGGQWFLRNGHSSGGADVTFRFGGPGQLPVVGSWDGRHLGVGVVSAVGPPQWWLSDGLGGGRVDRRFSWGSRATDTALVGDWDGDGVWTPGISRANGRYLLDAWQVGPASPVQVHTSWDRRVQGDFDGNGSTTLGVVSKVGRFSWRDDLRSGPATSALTFTG